MQPRSLQAVDELQLTRNRSGDLQFHILLKAAKSSRDISSVPNQKFFSDVSPGLSGRKKVAHGVSRGSASPPSPLSPLPPARERGAEGRVRAPSPRAAALGYILAPLPGLWNDHAKREDIVSELLTQDTIIPSQNYKKGGRI